MPPPRSRNSYRVISNSIFRFLTISQSQHKRPEMLNCVRAMLGLLLLIIAGPHDIAAQSDSLRRAASSPRATRRRLIEKVAQGLTVRIGVETNHPSSDDVNCGELGADWALCGVGAIRINADITLHGIDTSQGWELYFHSIRRILDIDSDDLEVAHITGDLHKIAPNDSFAGFAAGSTITVPFVYEYWILFETDFMPRWWLVSADGDVSVIPNTNDIDDTTGYADPITGTNWMRTLDSPLPQANVTTRFYANSETPLLPASDLATAIIPTPLSSEATEKDPAYLRSSGIVISHDEEIMTLEMIQAAKDHFAQLEIPIDESAGYPVEVIVDCNSPDLPDEAAKPEGYKLVVDSEKATVLGCDCMGAFYGLMSLASLVAMGQDTVATVEVYDAPRFPVRSLMIDVSRNFHSKEAILRTLGQMAAYKLNRLHFHLADDEGWRLEIPDLPDLTDVGSKRCFDLEETQCLLSQLGSGPDDDFAGSGFFSRDDFIEILTYAKDRGISVVPEFDMPGHARAAVVSMEARYKRLVAEGDEEAANEYRLLDPNDESVFLTTQFYDKHSHINVCMPGAVNFVSKVVAEVNDMYQDAGAELSSWHFGGDEALSIFAGAGFVNASAPEEEKIGKGQIDMSQLTKPYGGSPLCKQFMEDSGIGSTEELITHFALETSKILEQNDIDGFVAWQDGVKGVTSSDLATRNATVNFWETLYWGGATTFGTWAEKGYKVIISSPDYLYFDFPYENNPTERGYYWAARDQSLRKVFNFSPENLPQNAETSTDRDGNGFTVVTEPLPSGLDIEDIVSGIQGQIWSETIRTDEQMEYMAYPRLIALAERSWHKGSWELDYTEGVVFDQTSNHVDKEKMNADWALFANVLGQREFPKLSAAGIAYRVPVPGAVVVDGALRANIELPGLPIEWSPDYPNAPFTTYSSEEVVTCSSNDESAIAVRAGFPNHFSREEKVLSDCPTSGSSIVTGLVEPLIALALLAHFFFLE